MAKQTDIRITGTKVGFEDYLYRTPIKFGGRALDRVTLVNVAVDAETGAGKRAAGFGSMTLGNVWAWPSAVLSYDQTLGAMKALAGEIARAMAGAAGEFGHPLDHGVALEEVAVEKSRAAAAGLPEAMPKLAALVVSSAFDAAIHDGFGKANAIHSYQGYGKDYATCDLGRYLGAAFRGEFAARYVEERPKESLALYHLVGALDALAAADVTKPVGDGLPETLYDWIKKDGLTHLKVKLNGDDLGWDIERVLAVNRVAEEAAQKLGARQWQYSLDFNEKCRSVEYLLEFVARLKEGSAAVFERVQYIEQPTARDLRANPANRMHKAAAMKPVVIDESLVDHESLLLAGEMGYSGVALKACKGITQSVLLAAAARKKGMFVCVQDLTCVGVSFLESAGLAAHIPGVTAVEGNGRQYCPAANRGWQERFPDTFAPRQGRIRTGALDGAGLGCVPEGYEGEW